jgi:SulP family sulfate permease
MTAVLIPIVHQYGIEATYAVGFIAGVFLVLAALARVGKYIHRLPDSLVEGLTAGIALVIALQQVAFVLGVETISEERIWLSAWRELELWVTEPTATALAVGGSVIAVNVIGARFFPRLPLALFSVVVATAVTWALRLEIDLIGELPRFDLTPSLGFLEGQELALLIAPAFSVALLAALESLLSAKIADRMKADGSAHIPSRELLGQGLANLITPLFGGVPATAALARTAVNVRAGATNPLAAIFHALILAAFVLVLAEWVSMIPLAALGGVLVATAWKMVHVENLRVLFKKSTADAAILTVTMLTAVLVDLIAAVIVGIVLTLALGKRRG